MSIKAAIATSPGAEKSKIDAANLSAWLKHCWSHDINWDLYPSFMKEVSGTCTNCDVCVFLLPAACISIYWLDYYTELPI